MTQPEPYILKDNERIWVEEARDWVKGHFTESHDEKYASVEGKLRVIGAILEHGWIEPSETWKLQSLGIAFGDALAQELGLQWVTVEDEFGRAPALNWPQTSVLSFPLTMISKRIEHGETIDVWLLFEGVAAQIEEMATSGNYS